MVVDRSTKTSNPAGSPTVRPADQKEQEAGLREAQHGAVDRTSPLARQEEADSRDSDLGPSQ